ncbi:Os09g0357850, partial [Oryza sativa Japonica Group]
EGDRERGKVGDQGDCGGRGRRRPPLSLSGASTHGGAAGRAVDGGWRSALYAGAVSGGGRAGEGREQEEGGNGGRGGGRSCDCRSPFPPLPASVPVASRLSVALVAAYRLLTVRRGGRWTVTPGVDGGAQERVVGGGRRRAGAGGGWRHAGAGGRRRHRRARRGAVRLRRRRQQWRRRRTRSCGRTGWHNATVATVIGDGRIALLSGISAQDLFVWFPVYGIRVDVPCSSVIYFNVGVVFKHFPLAVCEAPPPSPDTGLGLGRQCRWGQRPHGRH